MFKRFAVQTQTKLVRTPKSNKKTEETPKSPPIDYVQVAQKAGKDAVIAVGALVGGYVVLDTLRQVTIVIVKAKM